MNRSQLKTVEWCKSRTPCNCGTVLQFHIEDSAQSATGFQTNTTTPTPSLQCKLGLCSPQKNITPTRRKAQQRLEERRSRGSSRCKARLMATSRLHSQVAGLSGRSLFQSNRVYLDSNSQGAPSRPRRSAFTSKMLLATW